MYNYCSEHDKWSKANGGVGSQHAYDHSAKPRGDHCFWCGIHRDGKSHAKPQAQGYSEDDWWNDAIAFGFTVED